MNKFPTQDFINITESNLVTYSLKLQTAFREGYRIMETHLPNELGFAYNAILFKTEEAEKKAVGRPRKDA